MADTTIRNDSCLPTPTTRIGKWRWRRIPPPPIVSAISSAGSFHGLLPTIFPVLLALSCLLPMNPDPQRPKSLLMPLSSLSLSSVRGPRLLSRSHLIIIIFNLMRGRRPRTLDNFFFFCLLVVVLFVFAAWLDLAWSLAGVTSCHLPVGSRPLLLLPLSLSSSLSLCVFSYYCYCCCCCCTPCNATLYAAVDAFRGFCVYAMLSLGIPNARGHRQSLCPPPPSLSFFLSLPLDWHMCIGICFVDFPQHAVPICLVGLSSLTLPLSLYMCLIACLPALPGVKVQTWRKVVSDQPKRTTFTFTFPSASPAPLPSPSPFLTPIYLYIQCRNVPGLPFYAWSHRWLASTWPPAHSPCIPLLPLLCFIPVAAAGASFFFESGQTKVNCLTLNYENDRRHDMRERKRERWGNWGNMSSLWLVNIVCPVNCKICQA